MTQYDRGSDERNRESDEHNQGEQPDARRHTWWAVLRRAAAALRRERPAPVVYSTAAEEMRIWQSRARLFMIALVVVVLSACSPMQPAAPVPSAAPTPQPAPAVIPTAEPTAIPAEMLAALDTETQLHAVDIPRRDPRWLTESLDPTVDDVPLLADAKQYTPGDREMFWVHNSDEARNIEIEAELVYQTDVANVWVEMDQPYNQRSIEASIDRFSTVAYPALVAAFGSEWNPGIDGDPRLNVLHTTKMADGVAGYFYSADTYTTAVNPFSNEKEIFFINLKYLNNPGAYLFYETTLAHEFQHMIHWNQDRGEDLWLNEGLSEYAQEVAQYEPDVNFAYAFLDDPDLQLTVWGATPKGNGPHYGASYLFVSYLAQRLGEAFLSRLVAEQRNGPDGVQAALEAAGESIIFDELFADWVIANWVNDADAPGLDGRYGYRKLDLPGARAVATHDQPVVSETAGDVANYGTDYIVLNGEGPQTFYFQGDAQTQLAPLDAADGRMWWSNRGDVANPRLTRQFDLSSLDAGATVTMTVDTWWDIEKDYDYGYVMASRDGEEWTILPGQRTRTDNPTGNAYGAGYTGVSGDGERATWVQEVFDLSEFAGGPVWLRFSYVTDDAVNGKGWFVDNVSIPAIGYADDFEDDAAGWQSEGWVLTDNQLPQRWLIQMMTFDGDRLTGGVRVPIATDGSAHVELGDLGSDHSAVIAISGLTPVTTEPAGYRYWVEAREE